MTRFQGTLGENKEEQKIYFRGAARNFCDRFQSSREILRQRILLKENTGFCLLARAQGGFRIVKWVIKTNDKKLSLSHWIQGGVMSRLNSSKKKGVLKFCGSSEKYGN